VKASKKTSTTNRAFYLLIAGIAVAGIAGLTYQSTRSNSDAVTSQVDSTLPSVKSFGYTIGNPSAPLEVTEFGDFECPACGRFAELTEPDIRKQYVATGKVLWRFVDFPLDMHKNTWQASRAAACADEQGKFWEYHDALYQTQDQWNGEATNNPDKFMKDLGGKLGLKGDQFNECVDTKKTQAKVQAHLGLATQRHINQTPTFIVGDQQIAQAMTYDAFAKLLDGMLATAKPSPATPLGDTANKGALPGAKKGQ
jgi:protein-disulfide isomerase